MSLLWGFILLAVFGLKVGCFPGFVSHWPELLHKEMSMDLNLLLFRTQPCHEEQPKDEAAPHEGSALWRSGPWHCPGVGVTGIPTTGCVVAQVESWPWRLLCGVYMFSL